MAPIEHRGWLATLMPLLLVSALGSSVAALATALRGDEVICWRRVGAALSSSLVATLVVFFAAQSHVTDPGWLVALSILAGVGGWSLLDVLLAASMRWLRRSLGDGEDKS